METLNEDIWRRIVRTHVCLVDDVRMLVFATQTCRTLRNIFLSENRNWQPSTPVYRPEILALLVADNRTQLRTTFMRTATLVAHLLMCSPAFVARNSHLYKTQSLPKAIQRYAEFPDDDWGVTHNWIAAALSQGNSLALELLLDRGQAENPLDNQWLTLDFALEELPFYKYPEESLCCAELLLRRFPNQLLRRTVVMRSVFVRPPRATRETVARLMRLILVSKHASFLDGGCKLFMWKLFRYAERDLRDDSLAIDVIYKMLREFDPCSLGQAIDLFCWMFVVRGTKTPRMNPFFCKELLLKIPRDTYLSSCNARNATECAIVVLQDHDVLKHVLDNFTANLPDFDCDFLTFCLETACRRNLPAVAAVLLADPRTKPRRVDSTVASCWRLARYWATHSTDGRTLALLAKSWPEGSPPYDPPELEK